MIEWTRDLLAIGALASIGIGCWMLHPATAWIVVGSLVLIALLWPRRPHNTGEQTDDSR